ncbi:MAG TPA: endolytic transglycosylase MltG [Fodinibius sp.]|nr:endolytic transglycosylase MltG [Fodinibius sp.]
MSFLTFRECIIAVLAAIIAAAAIALPRWNRLYRQPVFSAEDSVELYLEKELDREGLIHLLKKKDLHYDDEVLRWSQRTLRWNTFEPGHYAFSKDATYEQLFSKLGKGLQDPIRLMLLPGQSRQRLVKKISESFKFDSLALERTLSDSLFLEEAQLDSQDVIGRLYPATYQFYWTASPQQVLSRLFETFKNNISSKFRNRLVEIDYSLDEIITLASIIEWESAEDSEKATVSGLYWNRLRKGMLLQADPTVNYAVGKRRRLTFKDYKVEHPYNTYLHAGLPPGPISNPSKSSIEAALYPEEHDYLYMVASPDGTHNFSKTYQEHLRKSAEWRRWLEKQYRIKRSRQKEQS